MCDYYEEDEGIHFGPYDDELINEYLIPKLKGDDHSGDFILHKNVYAKEPWLLDHNMDPFFQKNEWYYFVTRTQVSEKKIGCGKKAKRKITGDSQDGIERGNWKANATTDIVDKKTKKVIGKKQTLTYTRSNNNKKQKTGDGACAIVPGSNSSWIMNEYMLPEGENFQELVLCKIKIKKSKEKDDHYEASTSTYHHDEASTSTSTYHHHAASTSTSTYHHQEASTSTSHYHHEAFTSTYPHHVSYSSENQMIHDHDSVLASSSSEQQPVNIDYEINKSKNEEASSEKAKKKEDHVYINAPLVSLGHESSLAIGSGEEDIDSFQYFDYRVEEGKDVLMIINDHVSVLDSFPEKQPIDEAYRHDSENLGSEKNDQNHNNASLVCLESTQEFAKELAESLRRVNGSSLHVEDEILIYNNALCLDQDLFEQCDALRHT